MLTTLSPSCFAYCGHHLSPRIAIVFSLLSNVQNFFASHYYIFLISSSTSRSSSLIVYFTLSRYVSSTLFSFATRAHLCIFFFLSTTGIPLSPFWLVQVPCTKLQFQRFRLVHWAVKIRFIPISSLNLPYIPKCSSPSTFFFNASLSLLSTVSFCLSCTPQTSP